MIRMEKQPVEYQVFATEEGHVIERDGVYYDTIPYDLVRIYVDDDTLLESYLEGEYGYRDLYMGVPAVIGGGGIEKIIQLPLTAEEKEMLKKSADSVQKVVDIVKAKA